MLHVIIINAQLRSINIPIALEGNLSEVFIYLFRSVLASILYLRMKISDNSVLSCTTVLSRFLWVLIALIEFN